MSTRFAPVAIGRSAILLPTAASTTTWQDTIGRTEKPTTSSKSMSACKQPKQPIDFKELLSRKKKIKRCDVNQYLKQEAERINALDDS